MQNQRTSNSFQPSARIDDDHEWSQASLPWAPENSMAPFASTQFHPSLQTSYDPSLNSLNDGADDMSAPSYSASQFDPGYQPSYRPAPDSSTFGAYNTAIAPNFALDQPLNPPNPYMATPWDAFMHPPNTAAALPYSGANDQSTFQPTEASSFEGRDESGFASVPTGTPSLPAAYDPYRADDESSWLDPAFRNSPVDTSSANDVGYITTYPVSSGLGALTETKAGTALHPDALPVTELQRPTNDITSPTNHVSDKDMLSKTACDCLACSRIGAYRRDGTLWDSAKNAECEFYYRHSRHTIRRSVRETCKINDENISLSKHERTHYIHEDGYHCPEQGCKYKSSAWGHLLRHTRSIHCQNPHIYSCPKFGCRRQGDNGFTREDKLYSHIRNVHEGRAAPGRPGRPIQPAGANANNGAGYGA